MRTYDDANRLTQIRHEGPAAQLLTQIDYTWRLDNTIDSRTETDATVQPQSVATVTFEYDNRRRLTREKRVVDTQTVYDIAYTYDQLGNRLTKADATSLLVTTYFYDTVAANRDPLFQTNNNRLLHYEEKLNSALQRTVSYVYYKTGDVSNITIKDEGTGEDFDWYRDLAFTYYSNGSLAVVLWDRWKQDAQGTPIDYERLSAKEFRNHSPRARFLARDVDPAALPTLVPIGTQSWTDYDGVQPYNDFDVTIDGSGNPVTADTLRYTAGFGVHAEQTVAGVTEYLHGDLIRSTTLTTDDVGAAGSTFAYTAFGEPIGTAPTTVTRYGYAGGWGYESGLLTLIGAPGTNPITLQHLGARWYQPVIGRFVQRDPIGLEGGLNLYAYVRSAPTLAIDPEGLGWIRRIGGVVAGVIAADLAYHYYLEHKEKVKNFGKKTMCVDAVNKDIGSNDTPLRTTRRADTGNRVVTFYLRLGDGRISVTYAVDGGDAVQFYTTDVHLPMGERP